MLPSPLSGYLVVDLSRHLPGPLTARLLCDLGARVIKIEEPEIGDPVRLVPPFRHSRSALAAELLAGIESVALDLKREAARGVLERLLREADVLLESFRPGTLARLGLSPDGLRAKCPRLVLCSISGWGQEGPQASRAGHDLTYQALAGGLASTGSLPSLPVADLLGAWSAVSSILAALLARQSSGRGAHLDVALLDAAAHGNFTGLAAEVERPRAVGESLTLTGAAPCYHLYRASEGGLVAMAALEPKFWRRFCRIVGRPDLIPRQYDRSEAVRREVAEIIAGRDRAEWQEIAAKNDLPLEPVLSVGESSAHGQAKVRELVRRSRDGLFRIGYPVLFDRERLRASETVPELGEHTRNVLEEFGIDVGLGSLRRRKDLGIGWRPSLRRLLWRWRSRSIG